MTKAPSSLHIETRAQAHCAAQQSQSWPRALPRVAGAAVLIGCLFLARPGLAQNLFEADYSSGNIYQFTPNGTRSTFASGLIFPSGIAFDGTGNLFVVEETTGNVYEFKNTPGVGLSGSRSFVASVGFVAPEALTCNSAGDVFVSCYWGGAVVRITPGGAQSIAASGLSGPIGVVFDSANNLFVADQLDKAVYKFTPDGIRSTFASGLGLPRGLAFNHAGNLLVANNASADILEFTPDGTSSTFTAWPSFGLEALAVDNLGNVFAANIQESRIYEVSPTGLQSLFATGIVPAGLAFQPVPEPSAMGLLSLGFAAMVFWRQRGKC